MRRRWPGCASGRPHCAAVREALCSALKYSGALDDVVNLYVEPAEAGLEVVVRDHGKGFDLENFQPGGGFVTTYGYIWRSALPRRPSGGHFSARHWHQGRGALVAGLPGPLGGQPTDTDAAASLEIEAEVAALLARVWECAARRQRLHRPSPREAELLRLAGQGLSYKALAASVGISMSTVADMLQRLKVKYLASHPGAAVDIAPLAAARLWASEPGAL